MEVSENGDILIENSGKRKRDGRSYTVVVHTVAMMHTNKRGENIK